MPEFSQRTRQQRRRHRGKACAGNLRYKGSLCALNEQLPRFFYAAEALAGSNERLVACNKGLNACNESPVGSNESPVGSNEGLVESNEGLVGSNERLVGSNERLVASHERLNARSESHSGSGETYSASSEKLALRGENTHSRELERGRRALRPAPVLQKRLKYAGKCPQRKLVGAGLTH